MTIRGEAKGVSEPLRERMGRDKGEPSVHQALCWVTLVSCPHAYSNKSFSISLLYKWGKRSIIVSASRYSCPFVDPKASDAKEAARHCKETTIWP